MDMSRIEMSKFSMGFSDRRAQPRFTSQFLKARYPFNNFPWFGIFLYHLLMFENVYNP